MYINPIETGIIVNRYDSAPLTSPVMRFDFDKLPNQILDRTKILVSLITNEIAYWKKYSENLPINIKEGFDTMISQLTNSVELLKRIK